MTTKNLSDADLRVRDIDARQISVASLERSRRSAAPYAHGCSAMPPDAPPRTPRGSPR